MEEGRGACCLGAEISLKVATRKTNKDRFPDSPDNVNYLVLIIYHCTIMQSYSYHSVSSNCDTALTSLLYYKKAEHINNIFYVHKNKMRISA
jgi:hypothetical protein